MCSGDELFLCSRGGYNIRVSAETVRHVSTFIILFLTRHNESINDVKTTIFTHRPHVSLPQFSFCWWQHNRLPKTSQWLDNCDAITWIVISNSLDIDFIHGDIHGWLCKKHDIAYTIAVIEWKYKSKFETTNGTPHLALTGKLSGVFCYDFWENWPRYNGTAWYYGLHIDAS